MKYHLFFIIPFSILNVFNDGKSGTEVKLLVFVHKVINLVLISMLTKNRETQEAVKKLMQWINDVTIFVEQI